MAPQNRNTPHKKQGQKMPSGKAFQTRPLSKGKMIPREMGVLPKRRNPITAGKQKKEKNRKKKRKKEKDKQIKGLVLKSKQSLINLSARGKP